MIQFLLYGSNKGQARLVVFVDLVPLTASDQVLATIAQALGVRELAETAAVELFLARARA